jgi:hypothetical protein
MTMAEIHFDKYRSYISSRIEVNDAMVALLAGSQLAAHTLQLTVGSKAPLSEIFPAVAHIKRFNLRSDSARSLLSNADHHVASVALPYALATHEEFVLATIELLRSRGTAIIDHNKQVRAWNMHAVLFDSCGATEPPETMEQFHTLREIRNSIIHDGGTVGTRLPATVTSMGTAARASWAVINQGDAPERVIGSDGRLRLTAEHVLTAFAITKRIGRSINAALASHFDAETWARLAVEDFNAETTKQRNSSQWRRSLLGFIRMHYSEIRLSEQVVEQAARHVGAWTTKEWK